MSSQQDPASGTPNINASNAPGAGDDPNAIVKNLYEKNIEIVHKNKTLSLLSKLYEISILTLEPKDLAMRVSQTVLVELSFEFVGIFDFDAKTDSLIPLAFEQADRMKVITSKIGFSPADTKIPNATNHEFFKKVLAQKEMNMTENFEDVMRNVVDSAKLQAISTVSHLKTTAAFPLVVEGKALGIIILALNRSYDTLNAFEKESIRSFVNVVALALEKAYLYQELTDANAKLRELDRQKDAVLHLVAHQFKGPITTINFITELLLDGTYGELTGEQKENMTNIKAASKKMGSQADMVLDAAKITAGKLPLEPKPVDLNPLFREIIEEAENNAKQRKVNLKVSLPTGPMPTAILDKKYTQLAFDNLLSNAIKYTALKSEGGNVDFSVDVKNGVLIGSVKDTGVGIPKADQENIFKELYRASNAGKDGNGLGLHVTMGAIQAQGGKIYFESEENVGTTFFVELPLKIAPAVEQNEQSKK